VAKTIASPDYVDAPADDFDRVIAGRYLGNYEDGLGKTWHDPNHKI